MPRPRSLLLVLAGLTVPAGGFLIKRPFASLANPLQLETRRWATTLPETPWEKKLDSLLEDAVEGAQSQEPGVISRDEDRRVVEYLDGLKDRGVLSFWNR